MLTDSGQQKYITSDKRTYLAPAIDYIAKNFTRRIRNDDMAKAAGISTVYFRKLFTAAYGISPAAYLQNLRINKAKDMLKSDYGSITDIALSWDIRIYMTFQGFLSVLRAYRRPHTQNNYAETAKSRDSARARYRDTTKKRTPEFPSCVLFRNAFYLIQPPLGEKCGRSISMPPILLLALHA